MCIGLPLCMNSPLHPHLVRGTFGAALLGQTAGSTLTLHKSTGKIRYFSAGEIKNLHRRITAKSTIFTSKLQNVLKVFSE